MNLYEQIINNYSNYINSISKDVDDNLLLAIASELGEDNDLPDEELISQAEELIILSSLEEFYESTVGPELNQNLVDRLGVSLASTLSSLLQPQFKVALAKGKYDHINFKPPSSVAAAAARGLEIRRQAPKSRKGGLDPQEAKKQHIGSGVSRAVNLKNRSNMSPKVISMMVRFFARHNKNIEKARKLTGKEKNMSKAYQAFLLWGGSPGRSWANKVFRQMKAADKKSKKK